MSTRILILKDGVITPTKNSTDTNAVINSLGVVDLSSNQTIGGLKIFSGGLALPSTIGTSIGAIWRNIDNLEYKDSSNVTKILLNSAGNLSNLSNRQTALNNLSGAVTTGNYLRGNGTNVLLSAIQVGDIPTLNQNTTGTASNITGVLSLINGGTNSSIQNFVDLTTAQTVGGAKSFSNPVNITNNTASTSTTTGALIVTGGLASNHIKTKNAWLLETRTAGTAINADNLAFGQFAGTLWIDGGVTNLNLPTNTGMLLQFDPLFESSDGNLYKVQEFIDSNGNFWKRRQQNGVWPAWRQIAFV